MSMDYQFKAAETTYSLEAEKAILGNILLYNQNIELVEDFLLIDDFFDKRHKTIYKQIVTLNQANTPFDVLILSEYLATEGLLEQAGGEAYIIDLAANTPSISNIKTYANIVKDKAKLRSLQNSVNDIVQKIYSADSKNPDEVIDYAESRILDVAKERETLTKGPESIKSVIPKLVDRMSAIVDSGSGLTGLSTGFIDLDKMTSGLQRANMGIIAARPSMGKTVLGINIAQNVAKIADKPVLVFSLEMPSEDIVTRMLASQARVEMNLLKECNRLNDAHWVKITSAMKTLSEMPLYIDDTSSLTPAEMRSRARRLYNEHGGLAMILIDYLQLMKIPGYETNRTLEVSEISRSLKALAKELDIPVIALSQLNRAVDDRKDKRPMMSDLRESGAIEQDADLIMFIYRDEVYNKDKEDNKNLGEIIIGKQRNGPIGTVHVRFDGQFASFANLTNENDHILPGDIGYNE
ncbi:replicative DNA helicase [Francisella tularensis]|uniref:replicative DNA helicase n=1 Tax=Francisella tularensis TaxID=263 RepID=UPI000158AF64|nr:replicative DNA helicase [Francisella tularensis]AHH46441.1 DNA helicase [Francisella tularensis subsp. holarctica PHIT-FT049]AJI45537.1 replicative DNA helicase [Francisella tularensis subsp. novicida F6168]AJI73281.1 replicative DNA helicase [Francisella tularensis subsp. novicida D9876]AJJ47095.1 replicative DNA helicase [Francisella tularensis subsp. novicida]AJJ47121.1 replicative DNA helicase [Francisella tularensis subsp. novicida]